MVPISHSGNVDNNYHAFAPRFGLAYSMNEKTVIRMGFGMSYDIGVFGSNFGHAVTQNLPVLATRPNRPTRPFQARRTTRCGVQPGDWSGSICVPDCSFHRNSAAWVARRTRNRECVPPTRR